MASEIRPFEITIPEAELVDLRERLARTRWAGRLPGEGWEPGVPVAYLRELAEYWRTAYDWRAQEKRLNAFPQYMTEIDGLNVHFLHVRSPEPEALPLVLTHGWPNSVVEFTRIIAPLADPRRHSGDPHQAFHVVVPSVPGFGFSDAPRDTGFDTARVAGMWAELMRRLGYTRYGTQGGDLGAYVAPEVALADPEHVVGVHIDGGIGFPNKADVAVMSQEDRAEWAEMQQWFEGGVDHHALMRSAPQTFAYAWHDSPVGLLAWMMQKFQEFTPSAELPEHAMERDHMLTNVSLYWFTGTSGTSSWPGYLGIGDDGGFLWPKGQNVAPTGVYGDAPAFCRRLAARHNTVIHWPEGNPGDHFVAMEEPEAHAADIRAFYAKIR
jgi:epoxide hydrolase